MIAWLLRVLASVTLIWTVFISWMIGYNLRHLLTTEYGPFNVVVERGAANDEDARLIGLAESACPRPYNGFSGGQQYDDCEYDWWCGEYNGVPLPNAVTIYALQRYLDEVESLRQAQLDEGGAIHRIAKATLEYSATVTHYQGTTSDKRDAIVELRMRWYEFCGGYCGFHFSMTRTVVFDREGKIIWIQGDGCPDYYIY